MSNVLTEVYSEWVQAWWIIPSVQSCGRLPSRGHCLPRSRLEQTNTKIRQQPCRIWWVQYFNSNITPT